MNKPTKRGNPADHLDSYRRLRAAGQSLFSKVMKCIPPEFDMLKAAKKLTIPIQDQTLIFDSDSEMNVLVDYFLHEYRRGGKTVLNHFAAGNPDLTPDELEMLQAHLESKPELYRVKAQDRAWGESKLEPVFRPTEEVLFTDISMSTSDSNPLGSLLYTRVIACRGISMGSGFFFAFPQELEKEILDAYKARMKTVAKCDERERGYVLLYQFHRECGFDQEYRDVT